MKKICTFLLAICCLHKLSAQSANKTLSNLTAPVAVNIDLLPGAGKTINLGSSVSTWKNIYLDSGVYLKGSYGLFFNSSQQYVFRNGSQSPVFSLNAGNGNAVLKGKLKIGAYTLPATDGIAGQLLKTNGSGVLAWSNDNDVIYTAGSGINIIGNVISTTASAAWSLTGNGGINSAANFLGTTDSKPLIFKVNSQPAGKLDPLSYNTSYGYQTLYSNTSGNNNTANGFAALFANTTGTANTANGNYALNSNTTGGNNTAIGYQALLLNTTGYYNTANGCFALYANTTGVSNTANGYQALYANTTGYNNTANGYASLSSNTTGYHNTANGYASLSSNTTGNNNAANGHRVLYSNTTGNYNTANGNYALYANTTGVSNTANGYQALYYNTTGYHNTANGSYSLYSNTTGFSNMANGIRALFSNTTGSNNTANGNYSLYFNTTGIENTANGQEALYSNTTGNSNTANGYTALYSNTTGYFNTANGQEALYSNTTANNNTANGYSSLYANKTGLENTANGSNALYSNTTGNSNTANGYHTLYYNTTGSQNLANGNYALTSNTTGKSNTADGYGALYTNVTGSNNTALGFFADVSAGNLTNATALGSGATVDASNKVRVGNTAVTSIGGQVDWSVFSDGRYKQNIKEDVKGLAFINALRPVTYNLNIKALNEYYDKGRKDSAYMQMKSAMKDAENTAGKIIHTGFIAQEVEAAAKKLNYDFDGVDKPQTKDGTYALRYSEFVVPLVKAVQELSKMNDNKDARIDSLEKQNEQLQKQFADLKNLVLQIQQTQQQCSPCNVASGISTATVSTQLISLTGASLEQNIPNPFQNTTTIAYTLPEKFSSAKIIITDKAGKALKEITLSGKGKGVVKVDASTLAAGAYNYSLYVNGKLIGTKQMVAAK